MRMKKPCKLRQVVAFKLCLADRFQVLCKVNCKKQVHVQFTSLHRSFGQQSELLRRRKDTINKTEGCQ